MPIFVYLKMLNPSTVAPVRFSNGTPWRIDFNKNILVVRDSPVHARFYWTIRGDDAPELTDMPCWLVTIVSVRFWQQWSRTVNIKQPWENYTYVF